MSNIKEIHSRIHDYEISFENNLDFLETLLEIKEAIFILDRNVFKLYQSQFERVKSRSNLLIIDAVEENKTLEASERVFDKIISLNPTKKSVIVSFGGGITQDVSGFVASTFYRGLKWIYVPTTLLAQADSCMGSKTSLNYKSYKNILGTFYPPHQIFICPEFTNTLSSEDFYSGMGEVVKLHLMGGSATLKKLVSQLNLIHDRDITTILTAIQSSLDIKWTYMEGDEFDQGKRNLLNFGHEFGHAIETASQYKIPHGQAIIIGMIMANHVSMVRNSLSLEKLNSIEIVLMDLLKCDLSFFKQISEPDIVSSMKQDKKRIGNNLPLIMIHENFSFSKILDLTEQEATEAIGYFKKKCI